MNKFIIGQIVVRSMPVMILDLMDAPALTDDLLDGSPVEAPGVDDRLR